MLYMTISSQENHHFSLCSYFHAYPTTLLLKILGGPMHGPSPHLKFWGDRPPQSPPRSPPLPRPPSRNGLLAFGNRSFAPLALATSPFFIKCLTCALFTPYISLK